MKTKKKENINFIETRASSQVYNCDVETYKQCFIDYASVVYAITPFDKVVSQFIDIKPNEIRAVEVYWRFTSLEDILEFDEQEELHIANVFYYYLRMIVYGKKIEREQKRFSTRGIIDSLVKVGDINLRPNERYIRFEYSDAVIQLSVKKFSKIFKKFVRKRDYKLEDALYFVSADIVNDIYEYYQDYWLPLLKKTPNKKNFADSYLLRTYFTWMEKNV